MTDTPVSPSESTVWLELLGSEVSQRFYDAGGVPTRCLEAGDPDAPALVFLHGGGGHAETYCRNLGPSAAANFRVLAIDMLGHGFTGDGGLDAYTTDDFVEHLVALLDAAGIERAHLSGESFGGRVALWTAIRHPHRVGRLVLNTTGGLPIRAGKSSEDAGDFLRRSLAALDDPQFDTVRNRLLWLVHNPDSMPEEMVRIRLAIYRRPAVQAALRKVFAHVFDREAAALYTFTAERLAGVTIPTLVVWSDHNPMHTLADAEEVLGHLPDVRFHLVRDAAHWPHFEQADEYNKVALEFLLEDA